MNNRRNFMGALLAGAAVPGLRAQSTGLEIPIGSVAGHAIGRAVVAADQTIELIAYCPFLAGLSPATSLFSGVNSEKTAYFTLRSSRFRVEPLRNDKVFYSRIVPVGAEFLTSRINFSPFPNLDFAKPETYGSGQTVITLRNRGGSIILIQDQTITYTSTAEVLSSEDFTFQGRQLNLKDTGVSTFTVTLSGPAPSLDDLLATGQTFHVPLGGSIIAAASRG